MMKKEMILPSSSVRSGQYAASRPSVFAGTNGFCPDGFSVPVFSFCPFFVLGLVCTDDGAMPSCGIEINGTVGGL